MRQLTIKTNVTSKGLKALANLGGMILPGPVESIFIQYGGLSIVESEYVDSNEKVWQLDRFLPFDQMLLAYREKISEGQAHLFPFALDPGGWQFCLDLSNNLIPVLINRWTDFAPKDQLIEIAPSFQEFINDLRVPQEFT